MDYLYFLKYILLTVVGFIISISLTPIVIPILLVFFCYSSAVTLILKIKYGNEVYRATAIDVTHGKETTMTLPILNSAVRIKGDLSIDTIKQRLEHLILDTRNSNGHRRYKRLLEIYDKELGYNVWRSCPQFNIEDHIKTISLDDLYSKDDNEKDFEWQENVDKLLNRIGMLKFPPGMPQWNVYILDEQNGFYTALFRFHHAISDGIFLSRMFSEDVLDEPVQLQINYRPPGAYFKFIIRCWIFCLIPFGVLELLMKNDRNPLHGRQLTGKKRFFTSKAIPISKFMEIKRKTNTNLIAIMFSCVSFALSSHFNRRHFSVANITVLSPVPLQNPDEELKLKNKFAVAVTTLPTPSLQKESSSKNQIFKKLIIEKDRTTNNNAVKRLKHVQASLNDAKENVCVLASNSVSNILCSLLPESLATALVSVKGCTMCISNLPGIRVQTKLWSGTQVDQLFWVPDRDPMGAGVGILSFNDHMRAGFTVDEALIENDIEGKLFMSDFTTEIENILNELDEEVYSSQSDDQTKLKSIP